MSQRMALQGVGASPGVAHGPVVMLREATVDLPSFDDPAAAVAAVVAAMPEVAAGLSRRAESARTRGRDEAAQVLQAQALMVDDPMLADAIVGHLSSGSDLATALQAASDELETMLASLPDPYLAARSADVVEAVTALTLHLAGVEAPDLHIDVPSILVARTLTAAQTADLDPRCVLGFVTEQGGPTSHVAIIARSLRVPAVVGLDGVLERAGAAAHALMDGDTGEFILDPGEADRAEFEDRTLDAGRIAEWAAAAHGSSAVYDGSPIAVAANVASLDDLAEGSAVAADGVGLFRTEFLFLDRSTPPTEDEQYEVYRAAVEGFEDAVVIRTLDIGGDKPAEYLDRDDEDNPFLGMRGVRLYARHPDVFDTQLRACLRAAAHGPAHLMIPMVATASELRWVRTRLDAVADTLRCEGTQIGNLPLGAMVEVPSLALTASAVAPEVDFFSIGTNDLTQYTLAADRTHAALGSLQDPLHPAVLALCRSTVAGAAPAGRSVSVCGLAAADPIAASVFVALGVDKFSVTPSAVNVIKATVAEQKPELREKVTAALALATDGTEFREMIMDTLILP